MNMLALPTNTPQKLDASFMAALGRLSARYPKADTTPTPAPVISGIETDGTDAQDNRPTDRDLNEHYLTVNGWQRVDLWLDPKTGLTHLMADALTVQNERDSTGWSFQD